MYSGCRRFIRRAYYVTIALATVGAALPATADDFHETATLPVPISDAVPNLFAPTPSTARTRTSLGGDIKEIRVTAAPPEGYVPPPHPYETAEYPLRAPATSRQADVVVAWRAPNMSHRGVYFEDLPLERYGQTVPVVQPVLSYGQFVGDAILLPYKMGVDPVRNVFHGVGLPRPGSPTPPLREHLPFSLRGLAYQTGATTGIIFFVHP